MLQRIFLNLRFIVPLLLLASCQEEYELKGSAPTSEDAAFSFASSSKGDNYIEFTNTSDGFIKQWVFGNGATAEGDVVEAYYPFQGDYEVKLTVFTAGGSVSSTQMVNIPSTDPAICDDPVLLNLTGGCDAVDGKTWVIAAGVDDHFGVGPTTNFFPEYFAAKAGDMDGTGLYGDEFTFKLADASYTQETFGDIFVNQAQDPSVFPGAVQPEAGVDYTAPFTAPEGMTYTLITEQNGDLSIKLNGGGAVGAFMGYYAGIPSTYLVLNLTADELYVRYQDGNDAGLVWYQKFVPKQ